MINKKEGIEFGEEITDQLIELAKKDVIIKKFIQLICYYEKTVVDTVGFDNMPSESEIEDTLIDKIFYVNSCLKTNTFFTEDGIFDLNTEIGKVLFLREELLKEINYLVCIYYGLGAKDPNKNLNEKIEKDLLVIKLNENKEFLQNVYNNIIIKKNIMKFFSGTIFISHPESGVKISDFNYDYLLEQVPQLVKMIYSGQYIRTNGPKSSKQYMNVELSSKLEEEISDLNVRNFISLMVDDLRTTNHEFCQKIIADMIMIGRLNAKMEK